MKVGEISQIRRYPVKSMAGEILDEVRLEKRGLPGDRAWAVRDEVRGGIRGAKKIPALMGLAARYLKEPALEGSSPAEIVFPDGSTIETDAPDVNERVTKAIDYSVTLWPLLPADAVEHYRRGAPLHDDIEKEMRAMFARTADEPLPDLSVFPPELIEFESPPGTYFDAFPLLLMTEAALGSMQEKAPDSIFDVRRFRPNFLIGATDSAAAFPESEWCGRRLRFGEAIVEVTADCPRCVMTTHGFDDLPKDPQVMRALVRETGGHLGVYGKVEEPGRVASGDSIELLD